MQEISSRIPGIYYFLHQSRFIEHKQKFNLFKNSFFKVLGVQKDLSVIEPFTLSCW